MPQIVHLSVKYSKPERMETTLWTVGRDWHFGQRGVAVDAGSDITAYSLDWKAKAIRKLAFGSIEGTARFD
jgi:hypothetical protein